MRIPPALLRFSFIHYTTAMISSKLFILLNSLTNYRFKFQAVESEKLLQHIFASLYCKILTINLVKMLLILGGSRAVDYAVTSTTFSANLLFLRKYLVIDKS